MRTERPAGESGSDGLRSEAAAALALARDEVRNGSLGRAWSACLEAASRGRALGDVDIVVAASTTIIGPELASWGLAASRQALCLEALAMLGAERPDLRVLVTAQLAALTSSWASMEIPAGSVDADEAHRRFLLLHAEHSAAGGPARVAARLAVATRLRSLARAAADDEMLGWAHLWRLDAFVQLGLRVEFTGELMALQALVHRSAAPIWRWRLALVRACVAYMEDRREDLPELAEIARDAGRTAGAPDAPFLDLVLRAAVADRTGEGLEEVEAEVHHALAEMPFHAQGWRALLLVRLGRMPEAQQIWHGLAQHLDDMPADSLEWLVAVTTHARLAMAVEDRTAAARIAVQLEPFAHQHVSATVLTPYDGPVSLTLGELAAFLGDHERAAAWLDDARQRSEAMGAPAFARDAIAARDALGAGLQPLSPRESEVARALSRGLTNREIATEFFLSERTVEQHVRSILRKLDLPNRAAVATWVSRAASG